MALPNVTSLSQRIKRGSQGGQEFAEVLNHLLDKEASQKNYRFISSLDASGDYKGCDAIIEKLNSNLGIQYKFIAGDPNAKQKYDIKLSLQNAIEKHLEMDEWVLVTPDDFQKTTMDWLNDLSKEFNIKISHWGQRRINNLMLDHREFCKRFYPEFLNYLEEFIDHNPTQLQLETYFDKYSEKNTNWGTLFFRAQPTYGDFKKIFKPDYYKEIADMYAMMYRDSFDSDRSINESAVENQIFTEYSSTTEELKRNESKLPGGMQQIAEKFDCFLPGVRFYSVRFHHKNSPLGVLFSVWCFVNGRWVFIPKPWRVVGKVYKMNEDKKMKRLIKWIKFFGGKSLKSLHPNELKSVVNHIVHKIK